MPSGQSVRRGVLIGTAEEYETKSEAEAAAGYRRLNANADNPHAGPVTFGMVIDKYIAEEMPDRISTRTFYLPWLKNHIRPKWGEYALTKIKPLAVREWIRSLPLKKEEQTAHS
jgi:integrase